TFAAGGGGEGKKQGEIKQRQKGIGAVENDRERPLNTPGSRVEGTRRRRKVVVVRSSSCRRARSSQVRTMRSRIQGTANSRPVDRQMTTENSSLPRFPGTTGIERASTGPRLREIIRLHQRS
uniref:Uncharacterized protein n=1 Tax=Anopheles atroparvus TaxID=41427 RepID=A0AAG5CYS4_ANOAO